MVETTYDYIKRIENSSDFLFLLQKGIIPLSILDKKVFYERYILELRTNKKSQAITNTSIEFNKSEKTVTRAIKFMES